MLFYVHGQRGRTGVLPKGRNQGKSWRQMFDWDYLKEIDIERNKLRDIMEKLKR